MEACRLCPRLCGAKRDKETGKGFCRMGEEAVVARAAPHFWEEPCLSGLYGCGAVFFSGCTLRCCYCQNHEISHLNKGKRQNARELADILMRLEDEGVHAIELVTGTQFIPAILEALKLYRPKLPLVWNTSGYETAESLRLLENVIDVYLPDMKHVSTRLSKLLSGAEDYFSVASSAIKEMCRQTGPAVLNDEGILVKGTLVRHLVLPGCTGDSLKVLDFIKNELPEGTLLSLMRQYTPQPFCRVKGMDRRVNDAEYQRVLSYAQQLELPGFMQDKRSAEREYTPDFDLTGVVDQDMQKL